MRLLGLIVQVTLIFLGVVGVSCFEGLHCKCRNGWMGVTCTQHISNTTTWLPEATEWTSCVDNENISNQLQAHIHSLQFPGSCDTKHLRPVKLSVAGFGSIFLGMIKCISGSILQNHMIDVPSETMLLHAPAEGCDQSPRCYLEPWSACAPTAEETANFKPRFRNGMGPPQKGKKKKGAKARDTGDILEMQPRVFRGKEVQVVKRINMDIPDQYKTTQDYFWYHVELFRFLWRPNMELQRRAAEEKTRIGWGNMDKVIAMHVRHGDACYDHRAQRTCHKFAEYLDAARKIKDKYGVNKIFLATDDISVLAQAKANTEFQFMVRNSNSTAYYSGAGAKEFVERRLAKGDGDPGLVGWDAALDVEMLGHGHFFVGTLSSSLGRLGFMRMVGLRRYTPPFITLDYSWCPGHLRRGLKVWHVKGEYVRFDC